MLKLELADPDSLEARALIAELSAALGAITGNSGASTFNADDVRGPRAAYVLARGADGTALGCGALRPLTAQVAELKRMFARPGSAAGAALLAMLEQRAVALGYREVWLETRHVNTRAVGFYQRHGYQRIDNYGGYIGRAECACLGKMLDLASRAPGLSDAFLSPTPVAPDR